MATEDWHEEHTGPDVVGVITKWQTHKGYGFIEPKPVDGHQGYTVFARKERVQCLVDRDYAGWRGVDVGTEVAY